jgi:hypothetical protein
MHLALFMPSLILLLICSPTFSITALFTGIFFPNDKLALVILLCLYLRSNESISLTKANKIFLRISLATFFLTLFCFIFRLFFSSSLPSVADINHLLSIFQTLIFSIYFTTLSFSRLFRAIGFATFANVISALLQILFIISARPELTLLFSNYPQKVSSEYTPQFGAVLSFLPRAYGLFHEASSLSVLCALVLLIIISPFLYHKPPAFVKQIIHFQSTNQAYTKSLFLASVIGIFATYSLTGLLSLLFPALAFSGISFLFNLHSRVSKPIFYIFFALVFLLSVFYDQTVYFLTWTLTSSDRSTSTLQVFDRLADSNLLTFFFGSSLLPTSDLSWDVWTRFFDAFGLFASPINYVWYLYILFYRFTPFSLFGLCQSLTGGSLSAAQSLITLSVVWYFNSCISYGFHPLERITKFDSSSI